MTPGGGPRRFFFMHVMKTGGGTLLQQILANFEREEVYPFERYDHDMVEANYSLEYLAELSSTRRERIRVFTGHFPFVAAEMLGPPLTTITILRDPLERTISYLRHCRRHHEQHRDLPLEEIYRDPFYFPCFIHNHQAKLFALTVEDRPESYMDVLEVDKGRLALAKRNLERVDVLGVQDRFDGLLGELEQRFGWHVAQVSDRNVSRGEPEPVPESLRRRIEEDNAADIELYEHARHLLERRRVLGEVA